MCSKGQSIRAVSSMQQPAAFVVLMEHFTDPGRLKEAVICSQKCAALLNNDHTACALPISEYCPLHPREKQDLFCLQCSVETCRCCASANHTNHNLEESLTMIKAREARRLEESMDTITEMLEEMKREISGVREMKERVRNRKDSNITTATAVFAALRIAINEREKQIISDIKREADRKEKTLQVTGCNSFYSSCGYSYYQYMSGKPYK